MYFLLRLASLLTNFLLKSCLVFEQQTFSLETREGIKKNHSLDFSQYLVTVSSTKLKFAVSA